ncbi:hypothetical protein FK216_06135 [Moraxellaceae bacterium AER2_44_116]|nr:hypothetical protein [Moraxellaceae bacterium]TQC98434.1 hypothetical protein FK216_06135 [Moraxellaceae bacterium AER2_44_116]
MWEKTQLEIVLEDRLKNPPTPNIVTKAEGEELFARYTTAKSMLCKEIFPWIRANEPNLSDHSETHIEDVLKNAWQLVENVMDKLNSIELYFLCIGILFHDVGNIYGRKKHNKTISPIYQYILALMPSRDEMQHTLSICQAHTGLGKDKTTDTLQDLKDAFFMRNKVRLRDLAAIIRFADELAEGEGRTSKFMLDNNFFSEESQIYHLYAAMCSHPAIDKSNGRIILNFNIDIKNPWFSTADKLIDFINFVYSRVLKLDEERRYCKYYCRLLDDFKATSINIQFWNDRSLIELDLESFYLDDYVLPGSINLSLEERFPVYNANLILEKIKSYFEADQNE